jgi:hypothetical protein
MHPSVVKGFKLAVQPRVVWTDRDRYVVGLDDRDESAQKTTARTDHVAHVRNMVEESGFRDFLAAAP